MAKDDLSISEMKRIAHEIIDSELEQYGVKANVFPVTFIEYYNNYLFSKDKNFKLSDKIGFSGVPFIYEGGFRDSSTNDIVIFLHHAKKTNLIRRNLFKLVENCYHEVRHVLQDDFDVYSYEGFLKEAEDYITSRGNNSDYTLSHDKYFSEIDAHLYGVSKAKKYMNDNYPELYEKQKGEVAGLENLYTLDYLTYDMVDTVEKMIETRKKRYKNFGSFIDMPMVLDIYLSEKVPAVLDVFLTWDCKFKGVSEIINDSRFEKLDKRIVSAFFSCKYFLENVDMNSLSYEELKAVNEALEYTNDVYHEQALTVDKSFKEKIVSFKEYLNLQKYLVMKMNFIKAFLVIPKKVSAMKKEKDKEERADMVSGKLDSSKKLLKVKGDK